MVFKFIKEMVAAIKEGVDEGKTELAHEKAAKEAGDAARAAQLRDLPYSEAFHTALGGPYRSVFVGETAFDLSAMDLAETQRDEISKLIERDFNVTDRDSLVAHAMRMQALVYNLLVMKRMDIPNMTAAEFEQKAEFLETLTRRVDLIVKAIGDDRYSSRIGTVELKEIRDDIAAYMPGLMNANLTPESRALIATWISRLSYMASASVGLGYLSKADAIEMLSPLVEVALRQIKSWTEFGEFFVAGEKQDGTNNFIGRNLLGSAVKKLLTRPDSPWTTLAWPQTMSALRGRGCGGANQEQELDAQNFGTS